MCFLKIHLWVCYLLLLALEISLIQTQSYCPRFCKCDLYEKLNRADCSAERLISANIEIPSAVQLLDLSYNDITALDKLCLQRFVHLINLTLSHNAIDTIHLDAFTPLRRLRALDLSYNRLENIDARLIEANQQLITLNMEGNKFTSLTTTPLLRSTTLRMLNLRNAQINHLSAEIFNALPQIQHVDLAQNMLITFGIAAFNAPRQLQTINLEENPLICDQALIQMLKLLRKRGIEINISECNHRISTEYSAEERKETLLERMELLEPETPDDPSMVEVQPTNVLQIWHALPELEEITEAQQSPLPSNSDSAVCEGTHEKLCQRYRLCLEHMSHSLLGGANRKPADTVREKISTYTVDELKLAFLLGATTGAGIFILLMTCALCVKNCFELRNKSNRQPADNQVDTNNPSLRIEIPPRVPPPPPPQRSRAPRRSNPSRHSRAVVRQQYDDSDNFLARLFGRPARHQYYRTINQNTATLIRRLSRSNLFNNRLSQHFSDRDRDRPHSPDSAEEGISTARFYHNTEAQIDSSRLQRAETPPPNYGDVVVIQDCDRK